MTITIPKKTVRALSKINQAVILLLAEENKVEIIEDDTDRNHHSAGRGSRK